MEKTKNIEHSNKTYFREKLEVPQTTSPEIHSQQANTESKVDVKIENTMIELECLTRATEILGNYIVRSANSEINFLSVNFGFIK